MKRHPKNPVAVLVVCLAASTAAVGQNRDDAGLWLAALGNGKFESLGEESSIRWWFDSHYRMLEDAEGFNQSIVRPGLGYAVADEHTLWSGYAWIRNSPITGEDFDEHRIWQQWTYTPSIDDWSFLHRSRLEQRLVETGDDVGLRWRQMFRGQYTFSQCPQWSLVAWDEAFFHLNDTDWGARTGFDQNRAFFGVGYKLSPDAPIRIEAGYLNQLIDRPGRRDNLNHILSINVFF